MQNTTLYSKAKEVITQGADRDATYDSLNDYQRAQLTLANMADLGKHADELIIESPNFVEVMINLMAALSTQGETNLKIIKEQIGDLIIKGAIKQSKKAIDDNLNEAFINAAKARQFYDERKCDYNRTYDPMKRAIYNHPEI